MANQTPSVNPTIFISYRRKDARGLVKIVYQCLEKDYPGQVFFDKYTIQKGDYFNNVILQGIDACQIFMPVIGPYWDSRQNIKRLKQTGDYVRMEIEQALNSKKTIIPVLIDRNSPPEISRLPSTLQHGIFDRDAIFLGNDEDYWQDEIRRNQNIIAKYTNQQNNVGSQPIGNANNDRDAVNLKLCHLNREEPFNRVKYPYQARQIYFTATGKEDCGFSDFARRCGSDLFNSKDVKSLDWMKFCSAPDAYRHKELYEQIAEALGIKEYEQMNLSEIKQSITNHLQDKETNQKYVFSCTQRGIPITRVNTALQQQWWDAWDALLGNRENRNLLVFLFCVPGWINRLLLRSPLSKYDKQVMIGSFKGISRNDVYNWKDKYENHLTKYDPTVFHQEIKRLFRFHRKRSYERITDTLKTVI